MGAGLGYAGLIDVWGFVEFCSADADDCEAPFEAGASALEDEVAFPFSCEDSAGFSCGADASEENSRKLLWRAIVALRLAKGDEAAREATAQKTLRGVNIVTDRARIGIREATR